MDLRSSKLSGNHEAGELIKRAKTETDDVMKRRKNDLKVKAWRAKQKLDKSGDEELKERDRERKKRARQEEKETAKSCPEKQQLLKQRKCNEMQWYREKVKDKKTLLQGNNKYADRTNNTTEEQVKTKRQTLLLKKKRAVQRSQIWRLRVQLKGSEQGSSNNSEQDLASSSEQDGNIFSSRYSKYRNLRKVKSALPNSPKRKAEVLKNLINSPSTSKILAQLNVIASPERRRKTDLADTILKRIQESLTKVKEPKAREQQKKFI